MTLCIFEGVGIPAHNRKIILTSYILNATSLLLPIISLICLFTYISLLPGTASDKAGWGFGIIFLMIPVLVFTGAIFIISAIMTLFLKNKYLYILSFIVIFYYFFIAFFLKINPINPNLYFWGIV